MVSEIFDPERWRPVDGFDFEDITYHRAVDQGTVRIAFDRPEVRNAFRPGTVDELYTALDHARRTSDVGCVLITGNGPSPTDGGWAFCSGGDQRIRGKDGYKYEGDDGVDPARLGRLHILEVQRLIRFMPKIVIAVVPGWAVGGGHSLHVVCDLTLASEEHALFKQTDPDVASFDGGYGSALLARQVGQKRAREIFFLGRNYTAREAFDMGMANAVIPHAELETEALRWGHEINSKSPTAMRMLKFAFNACDEGLVGQQIFAGEACSGLQLSPALHGKRKPCREEAQGHEQSLDPDLRRANHSSHICQHEAAKHDHENADEGEGVDRGCPAPAQEQADGTPETSYRRDRRGGDDPAGNPADVLDIFGQDAPCRDQLGPVVGIRQYEREESEPGIGQAPEKQEAGYWPVPGRGLVSHDRPRNTRTR